EWTEVLPAVWLACQSNQAANRAWRQGQLLGDLRRRLASVVQLKQALAQFRGDGCRHEEAPKGTASRCESARLAAWCRCSRVRCRGQPLWRDPVEPQQGRLALTTVHYPLLCVANRCGAIWWPTVVARIRLAALQIRPHLSPALCASFLPT